MKITTAESKKKESKKPKEIASKRESATQSANKKQDLVPTTNDTAFPMEITFDEEGGVSTIDHSRATDCAKSVCFSRYYLTYTDKKINDSINKGFYIATNRIG